VAIHLSGLTALFPITPLAEILQEERDELLREAKLKLTSAQRELFELHYSDGLSLRAIAVRFGVSEAAVGQMHQRALQTLRRELGGLK
jgi:RNA polymerase sigma factor (sigma-70 family)